jgi:hypothetical protein
MEDARDIVYKSRTILPDFIPLKDWNIPIWFEPSMLERRLGSYLRGSTMKHPHYTTMYHPDTKRPINEFSKEEIDNFNNETVLKLLRCISDIDSYGKNSNMEDIFESIDKLGLQPRDLSSKISHFRIDDKYETLFLRMKVFILSKIEQLLTSHKIMWKKDATKPYLYSLHFETEKEMNRMKHILHI